MHVCCFVSSFRLSFEHPLCSSTNRERAFEAPNGWFLYLCGNMLLPHPFVAYFPKKNYSRRQIILKKFEGLREVSHISPNLCFFLVLLKLGLDWEKTTHRIKAKQQLKSDRTRHRTLLPSVRSVLLRNYYWRRTRRWTVFAQRPVWCASASVMCVLILENDQTLLRVRSRVIGHVRSPFGCF